MFRAPGMSRQPQGILASSPQLANIVQQRQQPVRMAQGGLNTTTFTAAVKRAIQADDRYALKELADPNNYGEAAKTQDGQNAIRMAAQAINRAAVNNPPTQVSTAPTVAVPDLIDKGIASVNEFFYGTDTKQTPIQTGLRAIDSGVRAVTGSAAELMSGDFMRPVTDYLTTPQLKGVATEQSGNLTDPSMLLPQTGETPPPVSPLVSDALNYENMYGTGDLNLGETLAATTTPTQDKAAKDAGASTDNPFAVNKKPVVKEGKSNGDTVSASKPLMSKVDIEALTTGSLDTPQKSEQALATGNAVIDQALKILQGSSGPKSDKAKAKALDETIGITGTYKERVEKRKTVLQDLLGERAKDIRTDANYNLMMTGLMIAAGESPDAMTNLAKGLAAGLKNYGDAAGEEAQAITKEDRALTIQAASEVGVEISAEKAAKIRAVENEIARDHESKMQDTRLSTAIIQTQAQITSNQQIALARIASTEQLAANSFGQNVAILGLQQDQQNKVLEKKQEFDKELLKIKDDQDSETFKLMKLFKDSAAAAGKKMTDAEAYIAVQLAGQKDRKPTDTTLSYRRLTSAGMPMMDAWLLSQSGAVSAMIKDMGSEEFQAFLQNKLAAGKGKTTFTVGQVVEQGGKKFRVTAVDNQGNPTASEEVK
jgi:hypothetical protein